MKWKFNYDGLDNVSCTSMDRIFEDVVPEGKKIYFRSEGDWHETFIIVFKIKEPMNGYLLGIWIDGWNHHYKTYFGRVKDMRFWLEHIICYYNTFHWYATIEELLTHVPDYKPFGEDRIKIREAVVRLNPPLKMRRFEDTKFKFT